MPNSAFLLENYHIYLGFICSLLLFYNLYKKATQRGKFHQLWLTYSIQIVVPNLLLLLMYWLKPKNVPIDLITLLILLVFNIIFAKTLHRISLKKMLNRRVSRYFKRYQKYKLFKNTPTKPKPVSHSPITTVPTPTTPTIGSKNSNNSNNTFSEESIKKEIEAMNDEELEKKIKEQKKTLRKQIETARKNAFKTRKRTEIEKTEKTIKDILDKFNLTEDMLNEE